MGVDVQNEETAMDISYWFSSLLSPRWTKLPQVFAFQDKIYWESPGMVDSSTLSMESIANLLSDREAMQDKTGGAWFKEKKKITIRFFTGSSMGMFAGIFGIVFLVCATKFCCVPICCAIFGS